MRGMPPREAPQMYFQKAGQLHYTGETRMKTANKKGFTLVELILAIALMAIIGTMIIKLISFSGDSFNRAIDRMEGEAEGDFVLQFIATEIRRNDTSNSITLRGVKDEILEIRSEEGFFVSDFLYTYQWIYQEGKDIVHRFSNNNYTTVFASPGIEGEDVFKLTYGEKIDSLKFQVQENLSIRVTVGYYVSEEDVDNRTVLVPIKSDY